MQIYFFQGGNQMKKTLKKVTASLTAMLMMFGSTYTAVSSASATNNEIQPKRYHVYGDVDDNGVIDINDAISIAQFMAAYKNETQIYGIIPVENAIEYTGKYCLTIPQAADVDGDGYITEADSICIQYYEAKNYDKAGRCGQLFYINE